MRNSGRDTSVRALRVSTLGNDLIVAIDPGVVRRVDEQVQLAVERLTAAGELYNDYAILQEQREIASVALVALGMSSFFAGEPPHTEGLIEGAWAALSREILNRRATLRSAPVPPPPSLPYGVSPKGAEQLCADWMRHLGATEAEVTQYSHDGGIDIVSARFVAQVKHWAGPVGAPTVREMAGVAVVEQRTGVVFTSDTFTDEAVRFAEAAGVLLFVFSPEFGTLHAASTLALRALQDGLGPERQAPDTLG